MMLTSTTSFTHHWDRLVNNAVFPYLTTTQPFITKCSTVITFPKQRQTCKYQLICLWISMITEYGILPCVYGGRSCSKHFCYFCLIYLCIYILVTCYFVHEYILYPYSRDKHEHFCVEFSDCKNQVTMYDLVSVICHHGTAGGWLFSSYIVFILPLHTCQLLRFRRSHYVFLDKWKTTGVVRRYYGFILVWG